MVLDRDRRPMLRLGIEARVITMRHGDFCEGFGRAAGVVQIERRPGKRFLWEVSEIRGYDLFTDQYHLFIM